MAELTTERLINELQSFGVRLADSKVGAQSRRGGAGPSDHKAVTINGPHRDGADPYGRVGTSRPTRSRRSPARTASQRSSATASSSGA